MAGLLGVFAFRELGQFERHVCAQALTKKGMGPFKVGMQVLGHGSGEGGGALQRITRAAFGMLSDIHRYQFDMVAQGMGPGAVLLQVLLAAGKADETGSRGLPGVLCYRWFLDVHCLSFAPFGNGASWLTRLVAVSG
ncbi:hypothetical protein A6E19_24810 [Pseudomonas putida]|nr:hypothetical protein A6E20_26320 [Pseudomonas putida]OCT32903.1 hypothetical protein A6E23_24705 [Pseudomonas putida]OCT34817.1 hypothetical protein A6E24_24665 [Pseudomonas putida]OCT41279.1 hypothetical protein A6E19_24810 [Pseudomonas putida]